MYSDEEFAIETIRVHKLPATEAERRWWELYHEAMREGRRGHAQGCLGQLGMLLSSLGREKESLRIAIRRVRECDEPRASILACLAFSLERNGRRTFARRFFMRALQTPDTESSMVKWHELARIGLLRTDSGRRTEG
jgi:hypothetical protein